MIGTIYKLYCLTTGLTYYGSTTTPLQVRLYGHINRPYTTSKLIIQNKNFTIEALETVEFEDKKELLAREAYYIKNFPCVNKATPLRTPKEWYRDNNYKDKVRAEYNDKYKDKKKEYYQINKEKRKQYQKEYYYKNNNKNSGNNINETGIEGAYESGVETDKNEL
jgi:hypothetical protein